MVQSYMHFRNFVIISLWKGAWPSFESLPKMHLDTNCEKLPTDGWPKVSNHNSFYLLDVFNMSIKLFQISSLFWPYLFCMLAFLLCIRWITNDLFALGSLSLCRHAHYFAVFVNNRSIRAVQHVSTSVYCTQPNKGRNNHQYSCLREFKTIQDVLTNGYISDICQCFENRKIFSNISEEKKSIAYL